MQGRYAPSSSDAGTTGSLLYDFYWGMELYPRLGRAFDLKTWTNCRMGMMGWAVLVLCYAAAQAWHPEALNPCGAKPSSSSQYELAAACALQVGFMPAALWRGAARQLTGLQRVQSRRAWSRTSKTGVDLFCKEGSWAACVDSKSMARAAGAAGGGAGGQHGRLRAAHASLHLQILPVRPTALPVLLATHRRASTF